ncbi:centrosomal protein of 41 kDa [Cololabis saira]|uniref:centrosomal protein of 41 kDa n=1 Tax=Cololabis saira TaxID=129043 RepID=UPI002AD26217|nr:centrosomal protein of 41 kDa [Cololabis saira]
MSHNRSIGGLEYMKKRIPKNAKYDYVKTKLDTGSSLSKYMERLEEIRKNYRYRKDEIFKRLKVTTFAQLVLQVASVSGLNENEMDGESNSPQDSISVVSEHTNGSTLGQGDGRDTCHSARSTLLSVISGVGELNVERSGQRTEAELPPPPTPEDGPYPDCPYLLLDVRDRDQYDCCHIISAHSFPASMLSRTMNPYTAGVLEYKNAAGKIIILYDEDERIASQAATIMCQRGFENLFMLCGGLKVIVQKFPSGMTTGCIPASCLSSPKSLKGKRPTELQPPAQTAEKRWRFNADELQKIQDQLDEVLVSNSRLSSRMSSSSSGQLKPSSRKSSSMSGSSSRPWK